MNNTQIPENKINLKNYKASAMIYSLIFLYICSLIAIGLISLFESQLKLASSKIRLEQRLKLADTGINIALSYLTSKGIPNIQDLKEFNKEQNNTFFFKNLNNYTLSVYIFDKNTVKKSINTNEISFKDIEQKIRTNGEQSFKNTLNNLNNLNNINPSELPFIIISKVYNNSKRNSTYKIALVNLEYFSRYMYFTNFEKNPNGERFSFSIGKEVFSGPVRTNDNVVIWTLPYQTFNRGLIDMSFISFYDSSTFPYKPTFRSSFFFTGDLKFYDKDIITPEQATAKANEIQQEKGGIVVILGGNRQQNIAANTLPDTEEKLQQIIKGGSVNLKANAKKINLFSNLTSEDHIKSQIWPDFGNSPMPTTKGIFIKTDNNSNINSALFINPENEKIYSLDLKVEQNVQAYEIKFEKDDSENHITIYKVDNTNFNIPSNEGVTNPYSDLKIREINNLDANSVVNLGNYFDEDSSFSTHSGDYNISGKALVLTKVEGQTKKVLIIKLDNNKTFPKNVIWVNGSIGDKLEEGNMEGGLSGEYNEPLTIIAKPASKRDENNFNDNYDIRLKGDLKPYGININPNDSQIPAMNKEDNRVLGVYADRVFIGTNAKNNLLTDINGKEHFYLYASIVAIKAVNENNINGYFQVEKVNDSTIWNDIDGNPLILDRCLHLYGGIVQSYRGKVSGFDNIKIKTTGFTKDYNYDNRLAYMNPPYFPTTGEYIVLFEKVLNNY